MGWCMNKIIIFYIIFILCCSCLPVVSISLHESINIKGSGNISSYYLGLIIYNNTTNNVVMNITAIHKDLWRNKNGNDI